MEGKELSSLSEFRVFWRQQGVLEEYNAFILSVEEQAK
jgi:hypothetical protein